MGDVLIVQHAEKTAAPGDPGLTTRGREQAKATAQYLAGLSPAALWSSPSLRARVTAAPIAAATGLTVILDARLRERMNWDHQTREDFMAEWARAAADRTFVPTTGDSSEAAGERMAEALLEIATKAPVAVVVSHGGVTVDAVRTIFGDEPLLQSDIDLIGDGVPSCAITQVRWRRRWQLIDLASTAHLHSLQT